MAGQYTSGTITIPGLSGSGTDFNEMIDKLYEVEGLHAQQLIKWKNDWQLRKDAFTEIRTELVKLQTALKKLNTPGKFLTKTFTSSTSSVATATISDSSEVRSYSLNVKQLAQAGMTSYKTDKKLATDTLGGTGTFSFEFSVEGEEGTKTQKIDIPTNEETTLQGLVSLINGHSENKSVTASLINTGNGLMLQLRNKETGDTSDVDVTTTGITAFEGVTGSWKTEFTDKMKQDEDGNWVPIDAKAPPKTDWVQGKNAIFTLDGSNTDIQSKSNIVKDVVPGMTFNLFGKGQTTIAVSLDKAAIKENVQTFVDAVNSSRTLLNELTAVNPNKQLMDPGYSESQLENQYGAILTGNYGVQLIISKLKSSIASSAFGFDDPMNTFSALSQIGIMTNANQGSDNYGLLEINTIKSDDSPYGTLSFDEALENDPEAVARLFSATLDGYAWGDTPIGFDGYLKGFTKPGTYEVKYSVDAAKNVSVTIDGHPAEYDPETHQVTSMQGPSQGIVVTLYDLTPGTDRTANVSMRQGKVNELLELLQGNGTKDGAGILDKDHGSLSILEDNYTKIMSNINEKIVKENERLLVWERRMRLKFSRLEATLARYNQINESVKSQIDSLTGGGKS